MMAASGGSPSSSRALRLDSALPARMTARAPSRLSALSRFDHGGLVADAGEGAGLFVHRRRSGAGREARRR